MQVGLSFVATGRESISLFPPPSSSADNVVVSLCKLCGLAIKREKEEKKGKREKCKSEMKKISVIFFAGKN